MLSGINKKNIKKYKIGWTVVLAPARVSLILRLNFEPALGAVPTRKVEMVRIEGVAIR